MAARLQQIWTYPIKGFAGVACPAVTLRTGQGIPFDRHLAVSNGQHEVTPDGAWTHCRAFIRLTKNVDIARWRVAWREPSGITLTHPSQESLAIELDNRASIASANQTLARWLPSGPLHPPRLERSNSGAGYWDHDDAALSIISLATVRELSRLNGRVVDPDRFRGNLLVDTDAPWTEFDWLGRSIRIGDTVLDIIRPIDRCTAPNVDPISGAVDINVPQLLFRSAGHIFCGVYARVRRDGTLRAGNAVDVFGDVPEVVAPASRPATAPPTSLWPRPACVTATIDEAAGVRSFWLRDSLLKSGVSPAVKPGQHLRLHGIGANGDGWRSYTISGQSPDGDLRITVKRVNDGLCSSWLHDSIVVGDQLLISGPHGTFVARQAGNRPVLFLSAGIGITPLLEIARDLADQAPDRRIRFVHVERSLETLALWPEVQVLTQRTATVEAVLHIDAEAGGAIAPTGTRFVPVDLAAEARTAVAQHAMVYLCGPRGFMSAATTALLAAGIAAKDIHEEVFISPSSTPVARLTAPNEGPFAVTFVRSGTKAAWTRGSGTLLDLADSVGLALPSHCRAGACGSCRQRVTQGTTTDVIEPLATVPDGTLLLCCSVPTSDIVVDA